MTHRTGACFGPFCSAGLYSPVLEAVTTTTLWQGWKSESAQPFTLFFFHGLDVGDPGS